mgnify:FL=1
MFEKTIEFICQKDYVDLKQNYPKPIKLNIPEWFRKLDHSHHKQTVKGCMPFLDAISSGYVLETPQDLSLEHGKLNNAGVPYSSFVFGLSKQNVRSQGLNMNDAGYTRDSVHDIKQLEGSPLVDKNRNLNFHKFYNPWKIKTPPGYSCLFTPPLNNRDDRFEIISGIVDTDTYPLEINFPFTMNGDKYPNYSGTIKRGTPYVQVIPFKRDKWKMKIHSNDKSKKFEPVFFDLDLLYKYKKKYWNKKSWT